MANEENLISTDELADLRGIPLISLKQIFSNNSNTRPQPICIKEHKSYFDIDEINIWLDNLDKDEQKMPLDKELVRKFLTGAYASKVKCNR